MTRKKYRVFFNRPSWDGIRQIFYKKFSIKIIIMVPKLLTDNLKYFNPLYVKAPYP